MLIRLKANIPEILVGVFLTLAVFAMGVVFSSKYPSQTTQTDSSEKTNGDTAKKEPPKPFWQSAAADPVAAFTLGLLIVGIFQAGFFFVQLHLIRESLTDAKIAADAAKRAAKATEDAVKLSRDTTQRQLRAYVVAKADGNVGIKKINGSENAVMVTVQIAIKNTGQTPAHDLRVISKTELLRHPIVLPFNLTLVSGPDPSASVLGAGEPIGSESSPSEPFDGNAMLCATEPESRARIYTWGTITYRDVFGCNHWTNFCSSLIFTDDEAVAHVSEHHNDAS
jgi:hypothetical protein